MASFTREIVTLQLGHYANFVGTHWWNIQNASFVYHPSQAVGPKEINSDILFREGQNLMNEVTYTPRLIAFDLKGSLNTMKQSGTLYDIQEREEDLPWSSDITMHKVDVAAKNEFLKDLEKAEAAEQGRLVDDEDAEMDESEKDVATTATNYQVEPAAVFGPSKTYNLDDSVHVWSDFLHPHVHPRTVHVIDTYQHSSEVDVFDIYGLGVQTYQEHNTKAQVEDRLHFFTEECDNLQGFHMLADVYNGFGGLSSGLLEDIVDDYASKAVLLFAVTPATFPDSTTQHRQYRTLNTAVAYQHLLQHSSVLLPLSLASKLWQPTTSGSTLHLPHLHYRADLAYHTSSVLAAAIDSLTLPYRTVTNPSLMSHLAAALTPVGRKVLCTRAAFPLPLSESVSLPDVNLSSVCVSLTPSCRLGVSADAQSVVINGLQHETILHLPQSETLPSSVTSSVDELIAFCLQRSFSTSLNAICTVRQPCRVTAPFPHIFTADIANNGVLLRTQQHRPQTQAVESVPVMTLLQSSRSVEGHLEDLLTETRKLDIRRLHRMTECGLEVDEYHEVIDGLQAELDKYQTDSTDMC